MVLNMFIIWQIGLDVCVSSGYSNFIPLSKNMHVKSNLNWPWIRMRYYYRIKNCAKAWLDVACNLK